MRATESAITCKVYRADGSELDVSPYVQHYSDNHSIGGVPSYTVVFSPTLDGEPAIEQVDNGDLLEGGPHLDGRHHGRPRLRHLPNDDGGDLPLDWPPARRDARSS